MSLYDALELPKTATIDQIKRSYRRLALVLHPDRCAIQKKQQAKERFIKVTEAYSVLSDPQKRSHYDKYGTTETQIDFSQFDEVFGMNFEIFSSFFDQMDSMNFFGDIGDTKKRSGRGRTRGGANAGGFGMKFFNKIFTQMSQQFGSDEDEDEEDEDQTDLTPQEEAILAFGKAHTKPSTKGKVQCTLCQKKVPEEQVLLHFDEKHHKQALEPKQQVPA